MQKNVDALDRVARLVLGSVAGLAAFAGVLTFGTGVVWTLVVPLVLLPVGVVLAVTGYTQQCLLNSVLGLGTCHGPENDDPDRRPPSTE